MVANVTAFTSGRDLPSVAENVELLTGQRGNKLDKAVTYRDLESLGVATLSRIGSSYSAKANPVLTTTASVVDTPTKPKNVQANGAFNTILIDWDEPNYRGHSYAEVWRAEVDNLSVAVKIGTSSANMYSDPIGGSARVYYWVRFVNRNDVIGPYNASAGTYAETAENIQNILDALQGQIEASHLAQSLLNDIAQIPIINSSVQAVANSKNKIYLQADAPTTGLTIGDIWYDSDDNNKPYRWGGSAWVAVSDVRISQNAAAIQSEVTSRANADTALSSRIDTIQATANNLTASVQTQSQAISTLENGAQAMWTVKSQVGDITAGIGLMTDSNGKSQVMISASQFFVFDPNSAAPTQSLFAVSDGRVVIQKAVIESATIETVTAMKLTADYVKAGVSISSPVINGGSLSLGNIYMDSGAAGFGKGGPYGGWGYGWNTIIYNDGSLYTNRLYASAGTFTGTVNATSGSFTGTVNATGGTFNNVTIGATCSVLGTLNANQIVGDIVSYKPLTLSVTTSSNSDLTVFDFYVSASTKDRYFIIPPMLFTASVSNTATSVVYFGSATQCTVPLVRRGEATTDAAWATCDVNFPVLTIPSSGSSTRVRLVIRRNGVNSIGFKTQNCGLLVAPVSTGTFV